MSHVLRPEVCSHSRMCGATAKAILWRSDGLTLSWGRVVSTCDVKLFLAEVRQLVSMVPVGVDDLWPLLDAIAGLRMRRTNYPVAHSKIDLFLMICKLDWNWNPREENHKNTLEPNGDTYLGLYIPTTFLGLLPWKSHFGPTNIWGMGSCPRLSSDSTANTGIQTVAYRRSRYPVIDQ